MGLKCRLLGHDYGDPEIEREREEKGDEVVATIRELQVCGRCGAEHLVSENKEVTSIRSAEEVGLDASPAGDGPSPSASTPENAPSPADSEASDGPSNVAETEPDDPSPNIAEAEPDAATASASPAETDAPSADSAGTQADTDGTELEPPKDPEDEDAVILDDEETERDQTQWPEETAPDPATAVEESAAADELSEEVPRDGDGDPVTDDAELIDADGPAPSGDRTASGDAGAGAAETTDRDHGEWPARDQQSTDAETSTAEWPEHAAEDEGFDAEPSDGGPAEVTFGGGLTPEVNGHASSPDAGPASDEGFARADTETQLEADVPDGRVEFYCPNCDHARTAGESSMRAGDICPECKRGYIAERSL